MDTIWPSIQGAWSSLLDLLAKVVTPDWGALIALIPVGLALAVVLFLAWIAVRYLNAGPKRRGPGRVAPRAPEGVHMPGPSLAPFFAAIGSFLFFFGLVLGVGRPAFWLGLAALVLTLLYWLREGMRDYAALDGHPSEPRGERGLPAVQAGGPPAGVHMPGPSFRPLLVALSAAILFAGLVVGTPLFVGGVILLFITLVGWLGDAGHEYRAVAVSDVTGHLESGPAPRYPVGTLIAFAVVLVLGIGLSVGLIPGTNGEGSTASSVPGASAGSSAAASGAGASGSGAMMGGGSSGMGGMMGGTGGSAGGGSAAGSGATGDVAITAQNIAYNVAEVTAPAGKPFTIAFTNSDSGVPHNVAIKDASGTEVFKGEIVTGPTSIVYNVPALPAGTYTFVCSVHPNMTGTLTAK